MPRVLVVEDEPLIGLMVVEWLAELGFDTEGPVSTVPEAIALINGVKLDAAILDVSLGNQDCTPLANALSAKGIPFALASGHAADRYVANCANALLLSKPYDYEAFRSMMTQLLSASSR